MHTTAQAWTPAGPVARALGVHSRTIWLFCHRIPFRDAEPPRTMETPQFQFLALLLLYHHLSSSFTLWQPRYDSSEHITLFPFVTATGGASVCGCVPCFLSSHEVGTRHKFKSGKNNLMLCRAAVRCKTQPSSGFRRQPRRRTSIDNDSSINV